MHMIVLFSSGPMLALTRIYDSADPSSTVEVARATSKASKRPIDFSLDSSSAFSEDFRDLVHTQLSLLLEFLGYARALHRVAHHASSLSHQKEFTFLATTAGSHTGKQRSLPEHHRVSVQGSLTCSGSHQQGQGFANVATPTCS